MLRKIAIGLAAAAIGLAGLTLNVSARPGGGGHGGGGMHGGGFAKVGGPQGGVKHRHWGSRGRGGYHSYGYSTGGSCWRWTPEGRVWVCGGGYRYGPSHGYGYGWRYRHHPGRAFGMHGGGRRLR
jgi:hypothetical protein